MPVLLSSVKGRQLLLQLLAFGVIDGCRRWLLLQQLDRLESPI
jgi:hypothetical protein